MTKASFEIRWQKYMKECYQCDGWRSLEGWLGIASEAFEETFNLLSESEKQHFKITELKEKYGTLRVDTNVYQIADRHVSDKADEIASDAEDRSEETCMSCGKPATTIEHCGWISTICDDCRNT